MIGIPNVVNGKPFRFDLTMKRYNEYISTLLTKESKENIFAPIESTLRSSNLKSSEIDYVFCVGGMTKYPAVWNAISNYFGKEPLKFTDSMESVSRGAAIYHHYNVKEKPSTEPPEDSGDVGTVIEDVTPTLPQTIYLNVKDGFPVPLIEAKTKAGTPVIHEDFIEVTSEVGVSLELYAGMSFFDPDLKRLENVKLNFPVGVSAGTNISLKLEYTQKGILLFEAWIKDRPEIKINLTLEGSQLEDEDIEKLNKEYKFDDVRGVI